MIFKLEGWLLDVLAIEAGCDEEKAHYVKSSNQA